MKILLPVDGSDYTKRMLAYIAAHEELLPGTHDYVVMTAVPLVPAHAARFLDRGVLEGYYHDQAEEVLSGVRAFAAQHRWMFREVAVRGHAADAIADMAATEKPDLIVMGSHGHSAFGSMLLGSVASGVLARCHVPVLLIR